MKENIIISSLAVLILALGIALVYEPNDKEIYASTNNEIVTENSLAMMYETGPDTGEYQISSDTSWPLEGYTFNAELSRCENGSTLTWDEDTKTVLMEANVSDKCYVYFDKVPPVTLVSYITNLYTEDGVNDLYYHDGSGTYGSQEAGDNSYRYAGANPNNYVCFGSDAASCPADNLYRIIGVFGNQVKLIKHEYANSDLLGTNGDYSSSSTYSNTSSSYYKGSKTTINRYSWNNNNTRTNTWSESNLNTVNLNTNYLNNIGSKWSSLIATTNWKVGGMSYSRSNTAKQYYTTELGSSSSSTTYNAKIGLMYVSDYGYAANPDNWSTALYSYDNDTNRNNNWMFMGLYEWTISRRSDTTVSAFRVYDTGGVDSIYGVYNYFYGVRPSFYLSSWILYSSGDGTEENPYRVSAPNNLIEFTINEETYYAEQGMTWKEWLESPYCTDNFETTGTYIMTPDYYLVGYDGEYVLEDEEITAGITYFGLSWE